MTFGPLYREYGNGCDAPRKETDYDDLLWLQKEKDGQEKKEAILSRKQHAKTLVFHARGFRSSATNNKQQIIRHDVRPAPHYARFELLHSHKLGISYMVVGRLQLPMQTATLRRVVQRHLEGMEGFQRLRARDMLLELGQHR